MTSVTTLSSNLSSSSASSNTKHKKRRGQQRKLPTLSASHAPRSNCHNYLCREDTLPTLLSEHLFLNYWFLVRDSFNTAYNLISLALKMQFHLCFISFTFQSNYSTKALRKAQRNVYEFEVEKLLSTWFKYVDIKSDISDLIWRYL